MDVTVNRQTQRIDSRKIQDAVNRPGAVKPKDFVRELRNAGMIVLGSGKGCVQILNPDSGMKGHVNSNGESLNKPYRLKVARTLGVELRRESV